jgi:ComF family protein
VLLRALADILFPPLCHACRGYIPDAGPLHLCAGCLDEAKPVAPPFCTVCGEPFRTEGGIVHPCGPCLTTPRTFVAARAAALFAGPVEEMIHRYKYGRKVQLRRPLGLLAAERLRTFADEAAPDLLVPVPLHRKRLRSRGFNQALLIARVLEREWGVPLARSGLERIRWTEPQVRLSAAERERNVRGAFAVAEPAAVAGKRVMLVDDVFTTGSTVDECARVLRRAGATGVVVATVARAVPL